MNVSVVSAAIVEGNLVLGLSDGSIINCGFVQGPQGLKGDPGPMGATGAPGDDGNTIITIAGIPGNEIGKDGDYAINNRDWFIFGPKSGGIWGKGKSMLPQAKDMVVNGRGTEGSGTGGGSMGGGGAGSGGDGSGLVFTSTVIASGSGRLAQSGTGTTAIVNYPGSPLGMISPESGMAVQSNINAFFVKALEELEVNIPVVIDENRPQVGVYQGMLWFDTSEEDYTLYIYDGVQWVPAAPPVSLEGIEQSIYHISEKLSVVETGIVGARVDIAGNAGEIESAKTRLDGLDAGQAEQDTKIEALETSQAVQDGQIIELEEEIESLAPSLDRGKWNLAQLGENVTLASGEYAMGIGANRVYCEEQYEQCLLAIGGNPNDDPAALAECNRIAGVCFNAADGNGEYYMNDWSHATFLHFHKTDSDGKNHTFSDYEVGMFIDLFDQGDTGFAVFEITVAPTLDGDVYTIGVTPIQHEGEASGLARIKVFKLASADPTDYVRKTGDRMSGRLQITAENTGDALIVKGNTEGNTSIFYVRNARDRTQFRVTGEGKVQAGEASSPFLASAKNDLTTKAYVDQAVHEALTRELTAPANLEWYVYTNTAAKPSAGKAHVSGTSMLNSNTIILSLRPNNSAYEFQAGPISGTTMYNNQGNYRSVVLSVWYFREFNGGGEWKWKGTCDVDRVKLYDTYIYIVMGPSNYRTENGDFSSELRYRFTLSGFF